MSVPRSSSQFYRNTFFLLAYNWTKNGQLKDSIKSNCSNVNDSKVNHVKWWKENNWNALFFQI